MSIVELEWYEYTFNFKSDNIEAIVLGFEEAFGEQDNCTITINAADNYKAYKPSVKITPQGSTVELLVEFHVKNPYNYEMDAALIIVKSSFNIKFTVDDDFKLSGEITSIDMAAVDFLPYFKTATTMKNINA